MRTHSIKDRFLQLPFVYKLTGAGSILALISVFLPWYQDFDAFNTGDRFLGITGPLYLVGYIVLALSAFSLILTGFHFFEKKLPPLPMKEAMIYILSGAISLFLMVIANSVYLHPKFGINITSKVVQYGMIVAFAGAGIVLIAGVLQSRERGTSRHLKEFEEETRAELDPILELNETLANEMPIEDKPTVAAEPEPVVQKQPTMAETKVNRQPGGVREYKAKPQHDTSQTQVRREPYPDPAFLKKEEQASEPKKEEVNPNTVIRMDL